MKTISNNKLPRQVIGFVSVGIGGFAIDVAVFNFLMILTHSNQANALNVFSIKFLAGVISTLFAWWGNRKLTFQSQSPKTLEILKYFVVGFFAILIPLFCLFISRNIFGLSDLFADNISANIVGFTIATIFRFILYKNWVFNFRNSAK